MKSMRKTTVWLMALTIPLLIGGCGQGSEQTPTANSTPASASTAPGRDVLAVDVSSPAIGHLVGDKQSGQGLVSNGKAGFLMFGQYFHLDAGRYLVTVHGTMQAQDGAAATFDVVSKGATQAILKKQVSTEENAAASVIATLQFDLPHATDGIEVRALVPANMQMTLTGYTITRSP